ETGCILKRSLHDALPICAQGRGGADLRDGREPYLDGAAAGLSLRGDGTVRDADTYRTHPPAADDGRRGGRGTLARSQREHVAGQDRKSTRLNSSHVKSSY